MTAARRDVLLDTGPLVAALDAADQWHQRCREAVTAHLARCITTEAVLTEASHLVARGRGKASLAIDFVLAAGIPVVPLDRPALRAAARLMDRYANVPMDFADASLVVLAQALEVETALTTDRRGFRTWLARPGRPFRVLP